MKCLLDKERVIKYPCSPNCHLFGDCLVEFEKQNSSSLKTEDKIEKTYIEKESLRIAYEKSYQNDNHIVEGASAIHAQEHRHILHILDRQPEADVVPVKHGRWVSLTECANAGVYCSVCNKKVYKEDYAWCNKKNKVRSPYCPNCGAKMDLED